MKKTQVKELMTENPVFVQKTDTLRQAADKMREIDCGFLPIGNEDNVEGIITDRDIVIRAVSTGISLADETVEKYMTHEAFACNEDDFLEDAADKMHNYKVSRLLVRNHKGHVTGVLSFGGILRKDANAEEVANVVKHATRHVAF